MRRPIHGGAVFAALLAATSWPMRRQAVRSSDTLEAEEEAAARDAALDARAILEVCEERQLVVKRVKHRRRKERSRFSGRPSKRRGVQRRPCHSLVQKKDPDEEPEGTDDPEDADEEEPWEMTIWDKLNLEIGWMFQFFAMILVMYGFSDLSERLTRRPEKASQEGEERPPPARLAKILYGMLWGEGFIGFLVTVGTATLSVVNFVFYIWSTEVLLEADFHFLDLDWDVLKINRQLETISTFVFLPITLTRIAVIQCHPQWRVYDTSAHWRYVLSDIYIIVEIIAIVLSLEDAIRYLRTGQYNHVNLIFLFFARTFEALERSGGGLGVKRLRSMIVDDGKLLLTSFVMGIVVWLIMSGLYFTANRENEQESAVWEVATYNGQPWMKFESIPSTMWFVLLNLLKEHPLADAFETFYARLWVCVCCIFAMPVFAIPTSILQIALFNSEEALEEEEQPPEEESEEQPPEPQHDFRAGVATGILVYGSAVVYFYYTARNTRHSTFLGFIPVKVSAAAWAIVDGSVSVIFCFEWLYRIYSQGILYIFSGLGLVDLLAWVPALEHVSLQLNHPTTFSKWWQSASILRLLKMERYLPAWRDVWEIIEKNGGVLAATYLLALLLWMLFTVIIYITEAANPDPGMRDEFGTGMRAFWAELIVLHGEWPWCDFTAAGKGVGTLCGFFSVMLFCVPTSIFGDAFTQKISEEVDPAEEYDRRPWQQLCRPEREGMSRKAYDLFYAHLDMTARYESGFRVLRGLAFLFVGATTVTTLLGTLPDTDFAKAETKRGEICYMIDLVATLFFLLEFVGRIVALGPKHVLSAIGLCDLLSLAGFLVSLKPSWRDNVFHPSYESLGIWDDIVVLLRLIRLFSLDSYVAALNTLKNVFVIYRWPLARVTCILVSTWFIHAVLLYQLEQTIDLDPAGETDTESDVDMNYRYRSVFSALQYSIVHLMGDYPETEYTLLSKVVHVAGIMGGIAIMAAFCGVFSGCFVNYLEAERAVQCKEAACRRAVVFMSAVRAFQRGFRRRQARRASGSSIVPDRQPLPGWKKMCRAIAYGMTPTGRRISYFFNAVLLVAILTVMLASLPETGVDPTLPETKKNKNLDLALLGIEMFCSVVFLVEYLIRLAAYPAKAFTFWRMVDLVCLLPGPLELLRIQCFGRNGHDTAEAWVQALAMMRAVRILEFNYFAVEVGMIGRAVRDAIPKLAVPGYLALCVWITTSALFMWLENYFKNEKGSFHENMTSVPEAMYWCCIFLTGEWANIDFTYAGSRLCIMYVLFGIAMFSIPVGILVEAVQSTVQQSAREKKQFEMMMAAKETKSGEGGPSLFAAAVRASVADVPRRSLKRASMRQAPPLAPASSEVPPPPPPVSMPPLPSPLSEASPSLPTPDPSAGAALQASSSPPLPGLPGEGTSQASASRPLPGPPGEGTSQASPSPPMTAPRGGTGGTTQEASGGESD